MRNGLQQTLVEMLVTSSFMDGSMSTASFLIKDALLRETIRVGVLEAIRDSELTGEVKSLLIEFMLDEEVLNEILHAAISTVKTGIRTAVEDAELKEVLTAAIRDALEDPRLNSMLRSVLKDALADDSLHRATLQGAADALNPLKYLSTNSAEGESPPASAPEPSSTSSGGVASIVDWKLILSELDQRLGHRGRTFRDTIGGGLGIGTSTNSGGENGTSTGSSAFFGPRRQTHQGSRGGRENGTPLGSSAFFGPRRQSHQNSREGSRQTVRLDVLRQRGARASSMEPDWSPQSTPISSGLQPLPGDLTIASL